MGKIRGDARQIALAHPTRAALYDELKANEELATVELERSVDVTRYHLYHHLKQLQKVGLVENHRDQGRAKYWRVADLIDVAAPNDSASSKAGGIPTWIEEIPTELVALLETGGEMRFIPLAHSARDAVNSRTAINRIASEHGLDLELPFTFVPGGILVVSRRGR